MRKYTREGAAKRWAKVRGYAGRSGGWIYSPSGRPVRQGWGSFATMLENRGSIRPAGEKWADGYFVVDADPAPEPVKSEPVVEIAESDRLTRSLTAFDSFAELLNAAGNYRPTIFERDADHRRLADLYDAAQAERGDSRRAYRGLAAAR